MSKTGFSAFLLLILCKGYSQQNLYFVLIQADNNQNFYARIDQKIINSTPTGNLMMGQLKDSTYELSIGFPKSPLPESRFLIKINRKDQDLQLKDLGTNGWVLYNRQTQEQSLPLKEDTNNMQSASRGNKQDNAFSQLMAGVVNDSSVLYNTYVEKIPSKDSSQVDSSMHWGFKSDTVLTGKSKKMDTSVQIALLKPSPNNKKQPSIKTPASHASVQKLHEQSSDTDLTLVYVDKSKRGLKDTVKVSIPFEDQNTVSRALRDTAKGPVRPSDNHEGSLASTGTKSTMIILDSAKTESFPKRKATSSIILVNSDCKNFATELDVAKLRQRLASENKESEKIVVCKKYFKTKCFTVGQIKILSDLFPGDEWKFNFFEASFPFVSDYGNFSQLSILLSDQGYINRFMALIPKN
jgi:Domain of unknown function (DUF4476)